MPTTVTGTAMESYNTPVQTTTTYADGAAGAALFTDAPALVTRFSPPAACATDWFFAQDAPASVFSDPAHNPDGWRLCQPYNETGGHFSAGVCPSASEFKHVTRYRWEGSEDGSEDIWLGACCGSSSTLSLYTGSESACFSVTAPNPSIVASMLLENGASTQHTITTEVTVVATPLYMVWHEGDTALHVESDAQSLRVAMGLMDPTGKTATTPPTSLPSPESGDGEPEEKKKGGDEKVQTKVIVAGVIAGIACAALAALVAFLLWRRRSKRKVKGHMPDATNKDPGINRTFYGADPQGIGPGELGQSATQIGSEIDLGRDLVEMKALRSEVAANASQSSQINTPRSTPRFGSTGT